MSASLIAIVTVLYIGVAGSEWISGNGGMSVVFSGYAIANLGLIWQVWK